MKRNRLNKYGFILRKYVQNSPVDVLTVETNSNKKPISNVKYNELRRLERTLSKEFRTKVIWTMISGKNNVMEAKSLDATTQNANPKPPIKRRGVKKYKYELVLKSDEHKSSFGRRNVFLDVMSIDAESDYTPVNDSDYKTMLQKKAEIDSKGYMTRILKRSTFIGKTSQYSFINDPIEIFSKIKVGSILKHITSNYIAVVKTINSNNTGELTVIYSDGDFGIHCPFEINAKEIDKYFTLIK